MNFVAVTNECEVTYGILNIYRINEHDKEEKEADVEQRGHGDGEGEEKGPYPLG